MKTPLKFISSWDDGGAEDALIIELLKAYKLPGIFYLPGLSFFNAPMYEGFEIGGHTVNHPIDLKALSEEQIRSEILLNKEALQGYFRTPITKFCYPRGRYDERVIKILKDLGFTSARTTVVMEQYDDPFRQPTSVHIYPRAEYKGKDWVQVATALVEQAAAEGTVFHIWGHSWEIEKLGEWDKLRMFFDWLTENYEIIPG